MWPHVMVRLRQAGDRIGLPNLILILLHPRRPSNLISLTHNNLCLCNIWEAEPHHTSSLVSGYASCLLSRNHDSYMAGHVHVKGL